MLSGEAISDRIKTRSRNVTLSFGASEKFRSSSLPFVKYGRDDGARIGLYLPTALSLFS